MSGRGLNRWHLERLLLGSLVLALLAAALAWASPVLGQGTQAVPGQGGQPDPGRQANAALQAKTPLTVILEATEDPRSGAVTLQARVTNASGRPVGMQTVEFSWVPDFLGNGGRYTGRRPVALGQARTNVTGVARLRWLPGAGVGNGAERAVQVQARVVGSDGDEPARAAATVVLQGGGAGAGGRLPALTGPPLSDVRRLLGRASLVLVIGLWVLLAGLTAATVGAIVRAGREGREKKRPALPQGAVGPEHDVSSVG